VPDDLVDDVGLGGVEGHRVVAHVLRRAEHPLGERAVEVAGRHQPGHGLDAEARELAHAGVDLAQLRDPVGREGDGLCADPEGVTCVRLVLAGELGGDEAPHLVLLGGVDHVGDGGPAPVGAAHLGDRRPPGAVAGVGHTRVIGRQLERRRVDVDTDHAESVHPGSRSFNASTKFQTDHHQMA
jgi:hypothetical protein